MTAPTVGRIVHYRSYGTPGGEYAPACRAAIVTEVMTAERAGAEGFAFERGFVSLSVHNPKGLFFDQDVPQDESQERGGTWHWPCVRAEES